MTLLSHIYRSLSLPLKGLPRTSVSAAASTSSLAYRPLDMSAQQFVEETIAKHKIVVFSKTHCPFCRQTKDYFSTNFSGEPIEVVELDLRDDMDAIQDYLKQKTGARSVPRTFISGEKVGGNDDLRAKPQAEIRALIAKRI